MKDLKSKPTRKRAASKPKITKVDADKELQEAAKRMEQYKAACGSIDAAFDGYDDPGDLLRHILSRFQRRNEDNTQSEAVCGFTMRNADWFLEGPILFFPMHWFRYIGKHGKMMTFANYLLGRANNLGCIQKLNVEETAKDLEYKPEQIFSFITNFAGLGLLTIENPLDPQGRMYVNLTLHAVPKGYMQPMIRVSEPEAKKETVAEASPEVAEEKAAA